MSKPKNNSTNNKVNPKADYFVAGQNTIKYRATYAKTTIKVPNEFSNVFTGNGCFKGTFSKSKKTKAIPGAIQDV